MKDVKEKRFSELIEKEYNKNGNFNNEKGLAKEAATSAYHFSAEEIKPLQIREFGGLGAITSDSEEELRFGSKNPSYALIGSKRSGWTLIGSRSSGWTLIGSKSSGWTLIGSRSSGWTLKI